MGKSLALGTLLGAVFLFIWMAISWMALPWHCATLGTFTHEESVAAVVMSNTTSSGVYVLPNCHSHETQESGIEAMKKGPILFAAVQRDGYNVESPKPYVISFIIYLIGAFLVTLMVLKARLPSYGSRVGFIIIFGIAAGALATFPNWNWWGFSTGYTLVSFFDFVIGLTLAGLAIAAVTKPKEL